VISTTGLGLSDRQIDVEMDIGIGAEIMSTSSLNNWIIGPNSTLTLHRRRMRAGDSLTFNVSFTTTGTRNVEFGVLRHSNNSFSPTLQTTTNSITGRVEVTITEEYSMRIHNRGNRDIYLSGSYTYDNNQVFLNSQTLHDSKALIFPTPRTRQDIQLAHMQASAGLNENFGIFLYSPAPQRDDALHDTCNNSDNSALCNHPPIHPNSYAGICSDGGGLIEGRGHHRFDRKVLNRLMNASPPNMWTIGVIGYAMCAPAGELHRHHFVDGAANSFRRSVVSTHGVEGLNFLIQHELTHNFGVGPNDHGGISVCVMNSNPFYAQFNRWCGDCSTIIRNFKRNNLL
jgi:hypothetical protein